MSEPITTPAAPPSGAAPIPTGDGAPATPAAPSAPAATKLETLADYDRWAAESLRASAEPPQPSPPETPAAEPAPAAEAVAESPAAQVTPPAEDDPEPSAEVLASLNDAGRRALQAERDKRKSAREELKTLRAELEALKAQATPPTPPAPATPSVPEATPPAPTPSVPANLAECRTFEQVDAASFQAVEAQTLANELMMAMAAGDRETVIARLKAEKVEKIGATPIDDAQDGQLRQLIVSAQKGAALVIQQAPLRKQMLHREAVSYAEAAKILPGIEKSGSEAHKAFVAFVQQNPNVRSLGPNWPEMVAEGVAHRMSRTKTATVAQPAAPQPKPAEPAPTPRSAPSAPRTSAAVLPQKSELDEVRAKLANGTATQRDMDRYATLSLRGG